MPHTLIALALAGFLAGQSGATATTGTPPDAAAITTTTGTAAAERSHADETIRNKDAGEKVVCRNERSVGSNMITRVCKTNSERRKETQAARDALQSGRGINRDSGN